MDIDRLIFELAQKQANITAANHTATMIVDIAAITILIDAGLVSIEQAARRIEQIHGLLAPGSDLVEDRVQRITRWLRAHDAPQRTGWTPQVIEGGLGGRDRPGEERE